MDTWPNFFIVGAPRSGTTSLYAYLKDTPGVFMSSEKEPGYFRSRPTVRRNRRIHTKSEYLGLFKGVTDEEAIGEATPGYLIDPGSAAIIHDVVPTAKIIILLRDPVERAFSHYLMTRTKGFITQTFHQMITTNIENRKNGCIDEYSYTLDAGFYTGNVKRFQDTFGPGNVLPLIFEEFIQEPKKHVQQVLAFLEIDAEPPSATEKAYNAYGVPRGKLTERILADDRVARWSRRIIPQSIRWGVRAKLLLMKKEKPPLRDGERALLKDFYREDAQDLQKLLGREMPWPWINQD